MKELSLAGILIPWLKEKFPDVLVIDVGESVLGGPSTHSLYRIEYEPSAYIGSIRVAEVLLWDEGLMKLAGGRYISYDPRDPKFFEQIYEHLVRILQ